MTEGVVVDAVPVAADKGAHEQQQRALRLVEIRHHNLHYAIFVSGGDYYLCGGMQHIKTVFVNILQ